MQTCERGVNREVLWIARQCHRTDGKEAEGGKGLRIWIILFAARKSCRRNRNLYHTVFDFNTEILTELSEHIKINDGHSFIRLHFFCLTQT